MVVRYIAPSDPILAARISALFCAYERSALRHAVQHGPLIRRQRERTSTNNSLLQHGSSEVSPPEPHHDHSESATAPPRK